MTKFNIISLAGGFTKDTTIKFFEQIDKLSGNPLIVFLSGPGGSVSKMTAVVDTILSLDVPTTIISRDYNASANARFPHAGDFIRLAYQNSRFVYHETVYANEGQLSVLEESIERHRLTQQRKTESLMTHVGLTKRETVKYDGKDIHLSAEQCLLIGKYGMLDGIIIKDYRDGRFLIKTREGNKEIDITQHRRSDIKNLPVVKG